MTIKGAAVMISHARYAYCAFISKVLVASYLAGKRMGKPGCPFNAFALPGGYCAGSPAASSGHGCPQIAKRTSGLP